LAAVRNVKCPQCRTTILLDKQHTRSVVKAMRLRTLFVHTVRCGVLAIKEAPDTVTRRRLANDLFEYLCTNKDTLDTSPKTKEMILEKLRVFYSVDGWDAARVFQERIQ
jgi:hypothetical protein